MKNKPPFIGIGGHKCGSTWLSECLREHPDIFMSDPKEIGYYNNYEQKEFSWYLEHFNGSENVRAIGEYSSTYLYDKEIANKIYQDFGAIKIICVVRPPIPRFVSHLKQLMRKGLVPKEDIKKYSNNNPLHKSGILDAHSVLKSFGLYHDNIKEYINVFGAHNVIVLNQEDFLSSPGEKIKEVYEFLDVSSKYEPSILRKKVSVGIVPRFSRLERWRIKIYDYFFHNNPEVISLIKKYGISDFYRRINSNRNEHFELDIKTKEFLKSYYANDWEKTKSLIA